MTDRKDSPMDPDHIIVNEEIVTPKIVAELAQATHEVTDRRMLTKAGERAVYEVTGAAVKRIEDLLSDGSTFTVQEVLEDKTSIAMDEVPTFFRANRDVLNACTSIARRLATVLLRGVVRGYVRKESIEDDTKERVVDMLFDELERGNTLNALMIKILGRDTILDNIINEILETTWSNGSHLLQVIQEGRPDLNPKMKSEILNVALKINDNFSIADVLTRRITIRMHNPEKTDTTTPSEKAERVTIAKKIAETLIDDAVQHCLRHAQGQMVGRLDGTTSLDEELSSPKEQPGPDTVINEELYSEIMERITKRGIAKRLTEKMLPPKPRAKKKPDASHPSSEEN